MHTQPAADPIALANQLPSKSRPHTTNNVEVEQQHPSNLLDRHSHMQSAYTCGKSDGPVQQQRSREAQQATMGDTAFRGVSLPSPYVVILFCVVIIFSVWLFSPVYPPPIHPGSPPTHPATTTLYPQTPTSSPSTALIKPSPSQAESISSWRLIPIPTRARSFAATGCPRRTDWASSISQLTGGF